MANFLSQLTRAERVRLDEELNYMNLAEIRRFARSAGSPGGSSPTIRTGRWRRRSPPPRRWRESLRFEPPAVRLRRWAP